MKLQISFDLLDVEKSVTIAQSVAEYADIIEIGTLPIYKYGIQALQQFKDVLPHKDILLDIKLVDRGYDALPLFADAGIDWITVMAGTSSIVIHSICNEAAKRNIKIMIDLLDSASLGQSALEAKNLGASALVFHRPYDDKESLLVLEDWEMIRGNTQLPIFVSAKINRENVQHVLELKPDGMIIGKGITEAENPLQEAQFFSELCKKH